MRTLRNLGYASPAYSTGYQPASFWSDASKSVGNYMSQLYPQEGADFLYNPAVAAASPSDPYALGASASAGAVAVAQSAQDAILTPLEEFLKGLFQGAMRDVAIVAGVGIIAMTLINARDR